MLVGLLRRLLLLSLIPVMVLAINGPANAVDQVGTSVPFKFSDGGTANGRLDAFMTMNCGAKAQWSRNGTSMGVVGAMTCSFGWRGPGSSSSGNFSMEWVGTFGSNGNTCDADDDTTLTVGSLESGWSFQAFGTPVQECHFTSMCWSFDPVDQRRLQPDVAYHYEGCEDVDLGDPGAYEVVPETCPNGTPLPGSGLMDEAIAGQGSWVGWHGHKATLVFTGAPPTNQTTTNGYWKVQYYKRNGTGTGFTNAGVMPDLYVTQGTGSAALTWRSANLAQSIGNDDVGQLPKHTDGSAHDAVGAMVTFGTSAQIIGRTKPSLCQFWFGPKVYDDPNSYEDVPWGEVNKKPPVKDTTPPASDGGDCSFSIGDPSTWLEGGMCAAVGLLGAIWETLQGILNAILGLAGQIAGAIAGAIADALSGVVQAILDGLQALWVPSDGFFDAKVATMQDAVDSSGPGKWFTAMGDWVPSGSASGCAGPTVSFDVQGVHESFQPLNACGGAMANVAAVCKILLSCGVVLLGGFACVRALGAGFGWNPGVGSGGGSA